MELTPRQNKCVNRLLSRKGGAVRAVFACTDWFYVSECDLATVAKYKWHINTEGYVRTSFKVDGKNRYLLLHTLILKAKKGQLIDHKDRNKLNNTRDNIRISNHSQNGYNRETKGVRQLSSGNWMARIFVAGKEVSLGTYPTFEWAKKASLEAKKVYGAY